MRFSTAFLAAGLTATVLAAPAAQYDDTCAGPSGVPGTVASSAAQAVAKPKSSGTQAGATPASPASYGAAVPTSAAAVTSASARKSQAGSVTSSASAAKGTTSSSKKRFQFLGANESGAEFGQTNIPGVLGTDYIWPNTTAIKALMDTGMNIFRIPFLMERMAPKTMTAAIDTTYLAGMTTVVDFITKAGGHAVLDAQNFGRYSGSIITSTTDFKTFWTNLATEYKSNANVIFDCNNEFHDMPSNTLVVQLNQACIDGVRAAGATTQYVFVEGTSYTGAWTWTSSGNADSMGSLTDPSNKIVYEMHQYLDHNGSGTSDVCDSSTIGAERVADATAWLKANNKIGILGEFAGGANSVCQTAITGMLDTLAANSDVWIGAMWWGAGPWWANYIFSMEPPSGTGFVAYSSILAAYMPAATY